MASTKFIKRDKNRFRKVYPYIRARPRNQFCSDKEVIIEIGSVSFDGSTSVSYTFTQTYKSAPIITAISVDSESNNQADVNVFLSSVSTTSAIFETSQEFTGKIHFHIIEIS
jgi:hypothetical protein